MDPSIYDTSSPWSNLWLISSAIFAIVWALAITAALAVAVTVPYLLIRAVAGRSRPRTPRRTNRALLLAAAAVIILMAGTVTGLAYGVGAAKDRDLLGRPGPSSVAEGTPQSRAPMPPPSLQPD